MKHPIWTMTKQNSQLLTLYISYIQPLWSCFTLILDDILLHPKTILAAKR